jgi:hypothetical protein
MACHPDNQDHRKQNFDQQAVILEDTKAMVTQSGLLSGSSLFVPMACR